MATLHPQQARAIVRAETRYDRAKRELERAHRDRAETRAKYADRLTIGEPVEVAGYRFKRILKTSGARFRLSAFRDAGNKITKAMEPFVSEPTQYEDWQIKPLE